MGTYTQRKPIGLGRILWHTFWVIITGGLWGLILLVWALVNIKNRG